MTNSKPKSRARTSALQNALFVIDPRDSDFDVPAGWIEVQRCDEADLFEDDEAAALWVSPAARVCAISRLGEPDEHPVAWSSRVADGNDPEWEPPCTYDYRFIVPILCAKDAGITRELDL